MVSKWELALAMVGKSSDWANAVDLLGELFQWFADNKALGDLANHKPNDREHFLRLIGEELEFDADYIQAAIDGVMP